MESSPHPCYEEPQPENFISPSNSGEFKCDENENVQENILNIGRTDGAVLQEEPHLEKKQAKFLFVWSKICLRWALKIRTDATPSAL